MAYQNCHTSLKHNGDTISHRLSTVPLLAVSSVVINYSGIYLFVKALHSNTMNLNVKQNKSNVAFLVKNQRKSVCFGVVVFLNVLHLSRVNDLML